MNRVREMVSQLKHYGKWKKLMMMVVVVVVEVVCSGILEGQQLQAYKLQVSYRYGVPTRYIPSRRKLPQYD